MDKMEFLNAVNFGRYPKYKLSDVHKRTPFLKTSAIILTESGSIRLAEYSGGRWWVASFTSCMYVDGTYDYNNKQEVVYDELKEKVVYWIK